MNRDDVIVGLYKKKFSQKRIASELGISLSTVRRRMRVLSLSGSSSGVKVDVDDHYFDVIDCERKAYWLGFLASRGCLAKSAGSRRSVRFFLPVRDECVIRGFVSDIKYKGKVHFSNGSCGVVFNSVVMSDCLVGHGLLKWRDGGGSGLFDVVPSDLIRHFVRGLFDGGGRVCLRSKSNGSVCAVVVFSGGALSVVEDVVCFNVGVSRNGVKVRSSRCFIRWCGNRQVKLIGDWLYSDCSVFSVRKRSRFVVCGSFRFRNIQDFSFDMKSNEIVEVEAVRSVFCGFVVKSGWINPRYDIDAEFEKLNKIDLNSYLRDDKIVNSFPYGNNIVLDFCPNIWCVSRNGPAVANLSKYPKMVSRACKNFFGIPNRRLYPSRFVRELLFAGFSRASLLSVPVILAVIEKFGLRGRWFDPCAGWGNRLIASCLGNIEYVGTDPNTYENLTNLGEWLSSKKKFSFSLFGSRWEDLDWSDYDFLFTSPPFHDKEDYLDGVDYGGFEDWCENFIGGLIKRNTGRKIVLHVDRHIRDWIRDRYDCDIVELSPLNHHKLSTEYFVEIL